MHFHLLGVRIDNLSMGQALDRIMSYIDAPGTTEVDGQADRGFRQISFVNAHCMNVACQNQDYFNVLQRSDLVLADGSGIRMGARLSDVKVQENVNGTDMFPLLCRRLARENKSLYLLGAAPGVVEGVRDWVAHNVPDCKVVGVHDGFFRAEQEPAILQEIDRLQPSLVLVAFGVPGQEMWIDSTAHRVSPTVWMGVGGLFDFFSGRMPRAPLWLRRLGLEWTYRLWQEPQRMWRRYLVGNVVFMARSWWHRRSNLPRYRSGGVND